MYMNENNGRKNNVGTILLIIAVTLLLIAKGANSIIRNVTSGPEAVKIVFYSNVWYESLGISD